MKHSPLVPFLTLGAILSALLLGTACTREEAPDWQGYLEGEYVYVAAPLGGQLTTLNVARGDQVAAGAPLFTLEHAAESAAQNEASQQLHAVEARLADLRKGSRPSELATLRAQLAQARTAAELSQSELTRQTKLRDAQVNSAEAFDRAQSAHEQNLQQVDTISSRLETAQLGARPDAIAAAEAEVRAARESLDRVSWSVAQKSQVAPAAGLIHDTLYRAGEFVAAGRPVIALLPPENIKVRFFVNETIVATIKVGDAVSVNIDGIDHALTAHISYRSTQAEYTPPVLYNRENRAKLTYMIEAVFSPADARGLHPGQPVDVVPAP